MTQDKKPNYCGICGDGLFEEGPSGAPKRIGEVIQTSTSAVNEMQGSEKQKEQSRDLFILRVGLCPNCIEEYNLGSDGEAALADFYGDIDVSRVVGVKDTKPDSR